MTLLLRTRSYARSSGLCRVFVCGAGTWCNIPARHPQMRWLLLQHYDPRVECMMLSASMASFDWARPCRGRR